MKVFAIVAAIVAVLAIAGTAWASGSGTAADPYTTWDEVKAAVERGDAEVHYTGTIYADSTATVNSDVKLVGDTSSSIHRTASGWWGPEDWASPMFQVNGGTLTLKDVTLSGVDQNGNFTWEQSNGAPSAAGGRRNSGFFVTVNGGTLDISEGSSLQDMTWNVRWVATDGYTETASGGVIPYELNMAPVVVKSGAANMSGGKITNCSVVDRSKKEQNSLGRDLDSEATGRQLDEELAKAGVDPDGRIHGAISNYEYRNWTHTSGGILYMGNSTGKISNNSVISNNHSDAGAILAKGTSNITFENSTITDNTGVAASGGVALHEKAKFTMTSGVISNNTAWHLGGGVTALADNDNGANADGGSFVMNGGTINGNTTYDKGGGIRVESNNVKLNGGKISNNKARVMGGGVYVQGDNDLFAVLKLDQGYIHDNTATMAGSDDGKLWNTDQPDAWAGRVDAPQDNAIFGNKDTNTYAVNDKGQLEPSTTGNRLVSNDKMLPNNLDKADVNDYDFHSGSGGGIWSCPFGSYSLDAESVVINNNVAEYQGDDIHKDNGTAAKQDKDGQGGTTLGLNGNWDYDNNANYGQDAGLTGYYDVSKAESSMEGLNLVNYDTTKKGSGVEIVGNYSRRGGGIGSNGTLLLGETKELVEKAFLNITKTWEDGAKPENATVTLRPYIEVEYTDLEGETQIARQELDEFTLGDGIEVDEDEAAKSNTSIVKIEGWTARIAIPTSIEVTLAPGRTKEIRVYDPEAVTDDWPDTPTTWNLYFEEVAVKAGDKDVTSEYDLDVVEPITLNKTDSETVDKTLFEGTDEEITINFGRYFFGEGLKNIKGAQIEKYVNKDVDQNIVNFDTPFTYDIMAYVPTDATENLHIEDTLVDTIEFDGDVTSVVLKDTNDHTVNGTVAGTDGTDIKSSFTIATDGQKLTLDAAEVPEAWRGKWVQVTFNAKIKDTVRTQDQLEVGGAWGEVKDTTEGEKTIPANGTVQGGSNDHTGIVNDASYTVGGGHNYEATSNTVTVHPEFTEVSVEKVWKNANGEQIEWPMGAVVTVQLMNGDTKVPGKVAILESGLESYTFTELKKLKEADYKVVEASVYGVDLTKYFKVVTPNDEGAEYDFTVTNREVAPVEQSITVTKNLDGAAYAGSDFKFTLTAVSQNAQDKLPDVIEVTSVENGEVKFGPMEFAAAGEYTFKIVESYNEGDAAEFTLDTTPFIIASITVTQDPETGVLTANDPVFTDSKNTFDNTTVAEGEANIVVKKTLNGVDYTGDKFTYTIAAADPADAPLPETTTVTTAANGLVSFGTIAYAENGTYEYTITEAKAEGTGDEYTIVETPITATVTVDTVDGKRVATVTYADGTGEGNDTFANTSVVKKNLQVTKKLAGQPYTGNAFSFTAEAVTDNAQALLPEPATVTVASNGTVAFADVTYTQAGEYIYKITEDFNAGDAEVEYTLDPDTTSIYATVTVTQGTDGELTVGDVAYKAGAETAAAPKAVFNNDYAPVTFNLNAVKWVNDVNHPEEEGTFSFELTAEGDAPMPEATTATDGAEGAIEFGPISTSEAGIYTYTIKEVIPTDAAEGVNYDTRTVTATVRVEAADNVLAVTGVEYEGGFGEAANGFNNTTEDEPAIEKYVNKDVDQNIVNFDQNFTYDIMAYVPRDATENLHIEDTLADTIEFDGDVTSVVLKNDNNHTVNGAVADTEGQTVVTRQFEIAQSGQTLTLNKAEVPADWRGKWVQVTFNAKIKDSVRDQAALEAAGWETVTTNEPVKGGEESHTGIANKANYTVKGDHGNDYSADSNTVTVHPEYTQVEVTKAWKNVDGTDTWPEDVEVTVQLMNGDQPVEGKTVTLNATKTSDKFTDLPKLINADYKVVEISVTGVDAARYTTQVTGSVTDGFTVTNRENQPGETTLQLEARKTFTGGELAEGQFTFELSADRFGEPLPATTAVTNTAGGSVLFDAITFTEPGEYDYTIREVAGTDEGILYAQNTVKVHVEVLRVAETNMLTTSTEYTNSVAGLPANEFVNTKPEVEKYVKTAANTADSDVADTIRGHVDTQKDVHADIENFDQTFTYSIMAFVPADATAARITDNLGENLVFADPANVTVADMGTANDHTAGGTVEGAGTTLAAGTYVASTESNKLAVTISDPATIESLRGHWVRVEFDAKYNNTVVTRWAEYVAKRTSVDNNGSVVSDIASHAGIANTAGFEVQRDNNWSSKFDSNTVTVTPKTTSLEAEKKWQNAAGEEIDWPVDANGRPQVVTVKVMQGTNEFASVELDGDTYDRGDIAGSGVSYVREGAKVTFGNLPCYEDITYTIDENAVGGYTKTIDGTTLVNKESTGEVEKYVNQDVHSNIVEFDKPFTYDIMAYIPADATKDFRIVDTLNDTLVFANAEGEATTTGMDAVTMVRAKTENDHKVGGSVAAAGEEVASYAATIVDGKTLMVTLPDYMTQQYAGQWIQVTFTARIADSYLSLEALKASGAWQVVTDNAPVVGGAETHEGLANTGSYSVKTDNDFVYGSGTNTVTVTPEPLDVEITKAWVGDTAEERPSADEFAGSLRIFAVKVSGDAANGETPSLEGFGIDRIRAMADAKDITDLVAHKLTVTDNGDNTYTAKWTGLSKFTDRIYVVVEEPIEGYKATYQVEGEDIKTSKVTITNTKSTVEAEKYVNKNVHSDIEYFDAPFTYDIMAFVPADATHGFKITDTLVDVLEFADAAGATTTEGNATVTAVQVKDANDHAVNGSVAAEGTALAGYDAVIENGSTLVVTIPDEAVVANQGKWVQVTFNARIKDAFRTLESLQTVESGNTSWKAITDDGPVTGGKTPHEGVTNDASYTVLADNDYSYEVGTNTVTITPETERAAAEKHWMDVDKQPIAWPEGAEVDVKVVAAYTHPVTGEITDTDVPGATATLTANQPRHEFTDLPKLQNVNYFVNEVAARNVGTAFVPSNTITPNYHVRDAYATYIYNQQMGIEKYVNKDVDQNIVNFDQEFTYDIMAYIPHDVEKDLHIEDTLVDTLTFANTDEPVSAVVLKNTNDHTVNGTVAQEGDEDVKDAFAIAVDGQKLTLDVAKIDRSWQGRWVQVTFTAKIKDEFRSIETLEAAGWGTVTNNGTVTDGTESHTGILNNATYSLKTRNDNKYSADSNTVTVHPETRTVEVKKEWKGDTVDQRPSRDQFANALHIYAVTVNEQQPNVDNFGVENVPNKVVEITDQVRDKLQITEGEDGIWVATWSGLSKLKNTDYVVAEDPIDGYRVNYIFNEEQKTEIIVNTKIRDMEIEKYVSTGLDAPDAETEDSRPHDNTVPDVHADLNAFNQPFTYDIMAFIPEDADSARISDKLTDALDFDGGAEGVTVADMGTTNDHKAGGTVATGGTPLDHAAFAAAIDGRTLTVTIQDATMLRGHWVKVTFGAQYNLSVVMTWENYTGNRDQIEDNGQVISDIAEHRGTANRARYEIDRGHGFDSSARSNTVTVTPATEDVTITKVWVGDTADDRPTMEAFKSALKIAVVKEDGEAMDITENCAHLLRITDNGDNTWTATWSGLSKINGTSFGVTEDPMPGYITKVDADAKTITNTKREIEISKEDVAIPGKELPGARLVVKNAEGTTVDTWVSGDTVHKVALEDGTYTLTEITAPNGYAVAETITFTVNNGKVEGDKVVMKDAPTKVEIHKVELGAGEELPGATLQIIDSSGDIIKEFVSKDTPTVFEKLPIGTYTLREITAPDGYDVAEDMLFRINRDGSIECRDKEGNWVDAEGHVVMEDAPTPTPGPVEVSLEAKKMLIGGELTDGQFKFQLTPEGDAPVPAELTAVNDAQGNVSFGPIEFTEAGAYKYAITEIKGDQAGMEYAENTVTAWVNVMPGLDGNLLAAVTYTNSFMGAQSNVFVNRVVAPEPTTIKFEAVKVFEGGTLAGDDFRFELAAVDGAPMPAKATATNDADGKVAFGEIKFTEEGTYTYKITEIPGNDVEIDYASNTVTATVEVIKAETGALTTSATYENTDRDAPANQFTNKKLQPGAIDVMLEAKKVFEGGTLADGQFSFKLAAKDEGAPMPEADTAKNDAEGNVKFGKISFDEPGTYTYEITEDAGNQAGIEYADNTVTVTVKIDKLANGALNSYVTYTNSIAGVPANQFTNKQIPEPGKTTVKLEAHKVLEGGTLAGGQFEFNLAAKSSDAPLPANTKATNGADGKVLFDEITFDAPGKYTYEITEIAGNQAGIEYATNTVTANVEVFQLADGTLNYKVEYVNSIVGAVANQFTNKQTQVQPGKTIAELYVTKVLQGGTLGERMFEFQISPLTGGAPMPADTLVSNRADGYVSFGDITYDAEGTYVYQINEVAGNQACVEYATNVVTATVTVFKAEGGNLASRVEYANSQAGLPSNQFVNVQNTIKISKQDIAKPGVELPGATLVVRYANGQPVVDENGAEMMWISGTAPHEIILPDGDYVLAEVAAPEGYDVAGDVAFTVAGGKVAGGVVTMLDKAKESDDKGDKGKDTPNQPSTNDNGGTTPGGSTTNGGTPQSSTVTDNGAKTEKGTSGTTGSVGGTVESKTLTGTVAPTAKNVSGGATATTGDDALTFVLGVGAIALAAGGLGIVALRRRRVE